MGSGRPGRRWRRRLRGRRIRRGHGIRTAAPRNPSGALRRARPARYLRDGSVIGWARGRRREIGPRALGNRSILAAPFRLNTNVAVITGAFRQRAGREH
ncbi:carbamoyltransferase C-terminal domain-containing protein [Streptomyces jumonjinensis]|uniref:carbamoyltransferase C-terminal domain-containing protein n=1 Tax=Streptomyces jumonjinensis TaxID=1945 RepID=UPI0037A53170